MYIAPTIADFKARFYRDFPYGTDPSVSVLDQDVLIAFNASELQINQDLWDSQGAYAQGYLFLAAHNLVLNLRASSQGLNGQWNWIQNSKSAGPVNEAFSIPQRILDNPDLATYTKTNYGAQYLALLWPQLCGQIFSVQGRTHP